jgi:hypothetical protein
MGTAPTAEAASEEEDEPEAVEDKGEDEDEASACMRRRPEWYTKRRTKNNRIGNNWQCRVGEFQI